MKKSLSQKSEKIRNKRVYLKKSFLWKNLTDTQKTQILINSRRLFDHEIFLEKFLSWEHPDPDI